MSELKLPADSGGGSVSLKGPASTTSNADVPFVLPVADGSAGQYLKTDGSKNLAFATVTIPDDGWQNETGSWTDVTSGTNAVFTGWPADTEEIWLQYSALSVNHNNVRIIFELGTGASTFQQSGYRIVNPRQWVNNTASTDWTTQITFHGPGSSSAELWGYINLRRQNLSNRWDVFGIEQESGTASLIEYVNGYADAGGATMSHIRLRAQNDYEFDGSGKVRVLWRNRP